MTHYGEGEPRGGGNLPPGSPYVELSRGRTRQEDLESSDINNIIKRYWKTKELPVDGREYFFADVSEMPDYQTALHMIEHGKEAFSHVKPDIRARFDNDAAKFLDFTSDPANRDELVDMGLLDAPDEVTELAARAGDATRDAIADPAEEPAE